MTPHSEPVFRAIDHGLLCCASYLVPERQRAEWRLEWESELWHARQSNGGSGTISWHSEREIAEFCIGAFQDAACLRRFWWQNRPRSAPLHGSAVQCIFWLGCLLLASYVASRLLPRIHMDQDFSSNQALPGTILIQNEAVKSSSVPTMAIDQVRIWQRSRQRYADGFAFYRVAREPVEIGPDPDTWRVAQASSNLFAVAGWSLRYTTPQVDSRNDLPRLVLSLRIWRQQFAADPYVVGTVLRIGSRQARIVGIAPADAWRLPGKADAWLLEPDSAMGRNGPGYVIAHLTRSGRSAMWNGAVRITSYDSRKSEHDFLGKSFEEHTPGPASIYWFGILLALLALPAIATVSLAEYSFTSHRPSRVRRAVRLGFLAMKIVAILWLAYFSSIDLAYWHFPVLSPSGTYIQLAASFAICLFGLRWALLDQRQRCPVCLRRVTHPANVGLVSRMFLAWSGTELICEGGHTLLHVPGLPTSWFSTQRWMLLDSSWDFLFAG